MESVINWFAQGIGQYVSGEVVVFIISMIPILELRGGLLAAWILGIPIQIAIPICILGNIIPIPFILIFIKKIFSWMKRFKKLGGLVQRLEDRAMRRSKNVERGEFVGLMLFVGIPLPGTGAWTGSLIAALLNMKFKKAIIAELAGIAIATIIMSVLSYGLLDAIAN